MIKQILFIQMMQSIFHKIIFQEKEVFNNKVFTTIFNLYF